MSETVKLMSTFFAIKYFEICKGSILIIDTLRDVIDEKIYFVILFLISYFYVFLWYFL